MKNTPEPLNVTAVADAPDAEFARLRLIEKEARAYLDHLDSHPRPNALRDALNGNRSTTMADVMAENVALKDALKDALDELAPYVANEGLAHKEADIAAVRRRFLDGGG